MKVKVRRRKPAPVAAEQAKKKSDKIIAKFVLNGETVSRSDFTRQILF